MFRELSAVAVGFLPADMTLRILATKHYFLGERELRKLPILAEREKDSIDVGGHHGVYTYFLSRYTRWVHCYEPYPRDTQYLLKAFGGCNVTVYPFALSDHEGTGELYVPAGHDAEAGGQPSLLPPSQGGRCETKLPVVTKRLDQMGHARVGFIKVDVEGHERSVIAGAARLIEQQRPVLMVEVHGHTEEDPALLLREISACGYTGWFWDSTHLVELSGFRIGQHAKLEDSGARGKCYRKNFLYVPEERLGQMTKRW